MREKSSPEKLRKWPGPSGAIGLVAALRRFATRSRRSR